MDLPSAARRLKANKNTFSWENEVINNRGSLKQLVVERALVLPNIDFSFPTSKSEGKR